MTTSEAIKHLAEQLTDPSYREVWKSNIAMAYKDQWEEYERTSGKKKLDRQDRHIIANNAAEYFIQQLIKSA